MKVFFLVEAECYVGAALTGSASAGLGTVTFTVAASEPMPLRGMTARIASDASPSVRYMDGVVAAVDDATRTVTFDCTAFASAGTVSDWRLTTGIVRFSSLPFATGPTETPANVPYDNRVTQAAEINRSMFARGTLAGRSQVEAGEVVLANADGELDRLLDYGFDQRTVTILAGEADSGTPAYPSGFETVLIGTGAQPVATMRDLRLDIRTRQFDLDKPIQTVFYAGNNVLPGGIEGTEDDLKGQPKPDLWGEVENVTPRLVNSALLICQVRNGPVKNIPAVYDGALALARGSDYVDLADLSASDPAPGCYRVLPSHGLFRLGSAPAFDITCDVQAGEYATSLIERDAAYIIEDIVTRVAPDLVIVSADLTALRVANPAPLGLYIDSERDASDVLDEVCGTVGTWWGFDRLGQFRVRRLEAPAGSPIWTFRKGGSRFDALGTDESDILSLELAPVQDQTGGLPIGSVQLNYRRNWTVQRNGLAGAVTPARRAIVAEPWRKTAEAINGSTRTRHPLSGELRADTLFRYLADAEDERDRILAMRSVRRDRLILRSRLDTSIPAVDLGDEVQVIFPRFGCTTGRDFRVLGVRLDARSRFVTFDLWG